MKCGEGCVNVRLSLQSCRRAAWRGEVAVGVAGFDSSVGSQRHRVSSFNSHKMRNALFGAV